MPQINKNRQKTLPQIILGIFWVANAFSFSKSTLVRLQMQQIKVSMGFLFQHIIFFYKNKEHSARLINYKLCHRSDLVLVGKVMTSDFQKAIY